MDKYKRKELMEAYKQIKIYMGVYQIKNNENSKVLIGTSCNLKNRWLTLRMQLESKRHPNARLQKDWNDFGPDSFSYEVIEEKECKDIININWELENMEKEWLEKLQPYEDKGYNTGYSFHGRMLALAQVEGMLAVVDDELYGKSV
mgnify:CR=1 FL=1